ncbi:eryA [Symbiodinium sp. CCMP2592]|nr:eryA [Symbiodinium sp. CCMP2592]
MLEAWGVWPPPTLPSLGWFLISGGCCGLGLVSAAWLVTQGVTHLALLSRTGQCKENAQRQALEELCEAPDLQVCLRPCDVSIRKEVDEMLAALKDCDAVSVKGVLHAAGVLQDHAIAHLESDHLATVISPKMDGAINLHESLSSADIEHFLLFSSVAALLGSPGQGNYAAANSFLDSFALFRQARGLPALSVQWGPWADVGMAARSGVGGPGFWAPKISPGNALQALSAVIAAGRGPASSAALSITRVNWSALLKRMSSVPPAWADWKSHWERPVRTAASPVRPLRPWTWTGTDADIRSLQGQRRPLRMSTGEGGSGGIPFGLGLGGFSSFGITGAPGFSRLPERASRRPAPQTQGSKSEGTDSGSASSDSESPDGMGGGALGL